MGRAKGSRMTKIFFVRHGQARFGTADYDRLSDTGRRQSALLGDWWRRSGLVFDAFFVGPLRRHTETARQAAAALGPAAPSLETIAEFAEIDTERILAAEIEALLAGQPELSEAYRRRHQDADAYRAVVARAMQRSLSGGAAIGRADAVAGFLDTVHRGLDRVRAACLGRRQVAVFTSGGTIAATVQRVLDLRPAVAVDLGWRILNTSVTVCENLDEGLRLISFNAVAHLERTAEPGLQTLF